MLAMPGFQCNISQHHHKQAKAKAEKATVQPKSHQDTQAKSNERTTP